MRYPCGLVFPLTSVTYADERSLAGLVTVRINRARATAPSPRTPRSQESSTEAGVGVESPTVTWAISRTECRLGDLLTRGDVCHLHADRGDAERCGVRLGGAPELVRLDEVRPAVYRVVWSLSTAASGRLRRARPLS